MENKIKAINEIKKYCDLYDFKTNIILIQKIGYTLVSYAEKSIPSPGSLCRYIDKINTNSDAKVKSLVLHKDSSITLKTTLGNLRFWQ